MIHKLEFYFENNTEGISNMIEKYEESGVNTDKMAFIVSFEHDAVQLTLIDLESVNAYYYINFLEPKYITYNGIPIFYKKGGK